jgi:hypothetical protein
MLHFAARQKQRSTGRFILQHALPRQTQKTHNFSNQKIKQTHIN